MMKSAFALLIVGLIAGGAGFIVSRMDQSKKSDHVFTALDGSRVDLSALKGKIVVLSFGATWCPPCWEELPVLEELAEKYKNHPVAFYWVSIDDTEMSDEKLRQELKEKAPRFGFRVPVLRDPEAGLLVEHKVDGVPALLIFDREGKLVGQPHLGFDGREAFLRDLSTTIDSLLKRIQP
ncbi:MAG TPA: TlpA disulfide reductase family protein [Blastocatellia bacterium]|nr:TlpA disulfide reductase family protein [Blastocatellia bacterium]